MVLHRWSQSGNVSENVTVLELSLYPTDDDDISSRLDEEVQC